MTRTFTTIKKILLLLVLVSLASFLHAQAPSITCPGTTVTYGDQSTNDPLLWNATVWWDPLLNSKDMAENAVPLEITFTNACTTGSLEVKYILYLDLDNNGSLETRVDSDTLPAANTIHFNNNGLAITAGDQRKFDFRPVVAADKYRFDLEVAPISATERKAKLVWKTSAAVPSMAQLPHGTHKIKWQVTNGCGQQSTSEYTFIVRDDQPPTVTCNNGLQFNFGPASGGGPGVIYLWLSYFLNTFNDNLTPNPMLKFAIRKSGTGTGFPTDADGLPQVGVSFPCIEKGINTVEIWAKDMAGNTSFCEAYFLLKDGNSHCWCHCPIKLGIIKNELDQGIEDVSVLTENYTQGVPLFPIPTVFTSNNGYYSITKDIPYGPLATIRPVSELDPLNGVNIWDLILISRHILGLTLLDSPYKLIAADANQSGTVTTFDIVELRKLILGTYAKLPNNSSWRFVDKTQIFTNPENPFADTIISLLPLNPIPFPIPTNYGMHIYFDFIGTKIGDVDNTAKPSGFSAPTEDRTEKTTFAFQDRNIEENEVISLHFAAAPNIEGYQMTLDVEQFELLEIIPQNELTMDNFAVFEQAITMVTEQPNQGFDLRLRAKQAGQLSSMLAITDTVTRSVAFDRNGVSKGIALDFYPIQKEAIQLNQNVPNPWNTATNIGFYLPAAKTQVTFTVEDEIGRVVYTTTNTYPSGYQSIVLDKSMVPQAGIYWYSITTAQDKLVQKMVKF
jgi:methionine-rich copper-binding protein CopC